MNVIYLGGVGLGKTHLAIALGYESCLKGHAVLFASAIDVLNTLTAAKECGTTQTRDQKIRQAHLAYIG